MNPHYPTYTIIELSVGLPFLEEKVKVFSYK